MRRSSALALALATSTVLVGCDKCSREKTETAATTTEATTQPAAADAAATATQPAEPAASATDTGAQPAAAPADATATAANPATTATTSQPAATEAQPEVVTGTLKITDVKKGTGAEAVEGKKVTVHYPGTLENGTKFDSSRDRGSPFPFVLGSGMVIAGWEQGVKGMKVGGQRKLVIPPNLAYGNRSVGGVIPPNSTLLFEIELLKVE